MTNIFIPKHKLKQKQSARTLQADFFAFWRVASASIFAFWRVCICHGGYWTVGCPSKLASDNNWIHYIMEQGPVACLAQLAFFNIKPEKRRKAGSTGIQKENGRQEHHSLQGLYLPVCKQYGILLVFPWGTISHSEGNWKNYKLAGWRVFNSTYPLAFDVSSWSSLLCPFQYALSSSTMTGKWSHWNHQLWFL